MEQAALPRKLTAKNIFVRTDCSGGYMVLRNKGDKRMKKTA
jgi:hypothetical protein